MAAAHASSQVPVQEVSVRTLMLRSILVAVGLCTMAAQAVSAGQARTPTVIAGQEGAPVKPFIVNEWAHPLAGNQPRQPFKQAGQTVDGTPIPARKPWGHPDLEGNWAKRSGIPTNIAWQTQPLPFTPEGLKAYNNVWNELDPTS